jgi:hypothetical protein
VTDAPSRPTCVHCANGHTPSRRSETGEMVHTWSTVVARPDGTVGPAGTRFSVVLCVEKNVGVRRVGG